MLFAAHSRAVPLPSFAVAFPSLLACAQPFKILAPVLRIFPGGGASTKCFVAKLVDDVYLSARQ